MRKKERDFLYRKLLKWLNNEGYEVKITRSKKFRVLGWINDEEKIIYIQKNKLTEKIITLIHELIELLLEDSSPKTKKILTELAVEALSKELYKNLTKKQKNKLKSYLK